MDVLEDLLSNVTLYSIQDSNNNVYFNRSEKFSAPFFPKMANANTVKSSGHSLEKGKAEKAKQFPSFPFITHFIGTQF